MQITNSLPKFDLKRFHFPEIDKTLVMNLHRRKLVFYTIHFVLTFGQKHIKHIQT